MGLTCAGGSRNTRRPKEQVVALLGNPNTGKSTVFNALTGQKQHTGNWAGKTVDTAWGTVRHRGQQITLVDLPGTYSLTAKSPEEACTREFLLHGGADCLVLVADATCLERNLLLVLQAIQLFPRAVLCLNLMDEAKRKGIRIDRARLQQALGIPVVSCAARSGKGLRQLLDQVLLVGSGETTVDPVPIPTTARALDPSLSEEARAEMRAACLVLRAEEIANLTVRRSTDPLCDRDRCIDRVLTSRVWGLPVMLLLLALVLFLTIRGANTPSQWLSELLFGLVPLWHHLLGFLHAPLWLHSLVVDGVWHVLASAISRLCVLSAGSTLLLSAAGADPQDGAIGFLGRAVARNDRPRQRLVNCSVFHPVAQMQRGFGHAVSPLLFAAPAPSAPGCAAAGHLWVKAPAPS